MPPDRQTLYPNLKRGGANGRASPPAKKRTINGGQFQPGNRANPSGRPKGVPNFATQDVKRLARALATDPAGLAQIRAQYQAGQLPPPVLCMLWHYAFGKPKDRLDLHATVETLTFVIAAQPPQNAPPPQNSPTAPNTPNALALALSAPVSPEVPEAPEELEELEEPELPEEPPDEGAG